MEMEDLKWDEKERSEIVPRIFALRDDQLGALIGLVGPKFANKDIEYIVKEIRDKGEQSGNFETFLTEASSKEDLLWWISYFEKYKKSGKPEVDSHQQRSSSPRVEKIGHNPMPTEKVKINKK